jgi:hypothetical protein
VAVIRLASAVGETGLETGVAVMAETLACGIGALVSALVTVPLIEPRTAES